MPVYMLCEARLKSYIDSERRTIDKIEQFIVETISKFDDVGDSYCCRFNIIEAALKFKLTEKRIVSVLKYLKTTGKIDNYFMLNDTDVGIIIKKISREDW